MSDRLNVCLGYPLLLEDVFRKRLRAIDPAIRLLEMPIDKGGDWISVSPAEPNAEPPAWAAGCESERRAALAEAGGPERSRDEVFADYRRFASYSFVAAVTTAAAGARMQSVEVGRRAMQRMCDAVCDLDTLQILRESI